MAVGQFQNRVDYIEADIQSGTTTSQTLDLCGSSLVGIYMPAAFTGTAITFQVSVDGTNFQPMYQGSTQYSISVSAGRYQQIPGSDFAGIRYLQVVSGSSETGLRKLMLAVRPLY